MEFENEFDLPPASDENAGDGQDIPDDFVTYGDPDPTIAVPETRKIMTSAPLSGGGTLNADLTLGINAVSTATANSVILRDAAGRARVAAPVVANDIARKADVDAVDAKVSAVDGRVDAVNTAMGVLGDEIGAVDSRIDAVNASVAGVDAKVDTVDARVDSVDTAMGVLDGKIDTVDARVDAVEAQIPALSDAVDSDSSVVAASSLAVKTTYDKVVAVETATVPTLRNINTSGPLTGGGDLSADLTLGINTASTATANTVMQRDANGRARVAAPVVGNDIANKTYVDAVDTKVGVVDAKVDALDIKVDAVEAKIPALSDDVNSTSSVVAASSKAVKTAYDQAVTAETVSVPTTRNIATSAPLSGGGALNANLTLGINASSAATANYVIQRDANGRAQVAAPAVAADIARKAEVDAVNSTVGIMDAKVGALDSKVGAVDAKVGAVDAKVGALDLKVNVINDKIEAVDAKIPALSDAVDSSSSIVAASSKAVKMAYDKAVDAKDTSVPTTRSIATSAPLSGGGSLNANLTLGINASSAATANYVIQRDANGRAQVAAPSVAADISRKAEVDAVETKVTALDAKVDGVEAKIPALSDAIDSTSSVVAASSKAVKTAYDRAVTAEDVSVPKIRNINTSAPLSGGGALNADLNLGLNASSVATANYVIQRDADGRAQVAAPAGAADIARKAEVDGVDTKVDALDAKVDVVEAKIPALSDAVDSSSSIVAASSKAVKTAYDKAVNSEAVSVPTTRNISTTAPLNGGGALNTNLTLGINASSAATANYVIQRDASGRAKVAAPAATDDIARKAEVDALSATVTPLTRVINTTAPLTGGGDLSANRTLAINVATTAAVGAVQLATDAEASAGTVANKAATPTGVKAAMTAASVPLARTLTTTAPLTGGGDLSANRTLAINAATTAAVGAVQLATDAEVSAGTVANKAVTPTGVKAAMTAASVPLARTLTTTAPLTGGGDLSANRTLAINAATTAAVGAVQLATDAETSAGTVTNKAVTPTGVKAAIAASATASVPTARAVNTTAPLTGGGDLSANRTLSLTTVPITLGGTGLTAAPSLLTNLASTAAASPLTATPRPGVTGTLPIANGGTGATTAAAAKTALGITTGAPLPQTASGVGQWTSFVRSTSPLSIKLPAGGTWAYWGHIEQTERYWDTTGGPGFVMGVKAGDTILYNKNLLDAGILSTVICYGFCWRIS